MGSDEKFDETEYNILPIHATRKNVKSFHKNENSFNKWKELSKEIWRSPTRKNKKWSIVLYTFASKNEYAWVTNS